MEKLSKYEEALSKYNVDLNDAEVAEAVKKLIAEKVPENDTLEVKKFLFGKVNAILDKRKKEVESASLQAIEEKKKAEELEKELNEKLFGIDKERENIIAEAREKSGKDYDEVISSAKKEAEQANKAFAQ